MACHEALANPAAVYREDPENEAFTRIRSKPEIVEKYGTGRVSHNSMPALKQVTAALEQIEEYPEVDELGATAFKVRVDKVQEPNAQGIMEEVEQEVELYVRPPYTRRNKAVWMGTAERPIPIPLLSLLYRRVANTENRFLNQMSTTLKAKLHMFPAMTREENGYRSVRDSVAEIATAAIMHILKSFKNLEWDHWPVPIMTLVAGVVHAIVELSDPAYQMNARTTAGSTFKAKCRVDRVLEVLFSPRWGRVVCSGHHLRDPTACAPFVAASTEWFRAPARGILTSSRTKSRQKGSCSGARLS
eukprot:tig00000821_g4503.t1